MDRLSVGWRATFLVGVTAMAIGLILFAADMLTPDSIDPGGAGYIGVPLSEVRAYNAKLANWVMHENREATFELFLIGVAVCVISAWPYRRGERWSWYALTVLIGGFIGEYVIVHAPIGYLTYLPLVGALLILGTFGLVLPAAQVLRGATTVERRSARKEIPG